MMEAGVLLGVDNKPIYWHCPNLRNVGSLPDSRELWDVIWENRNQITGFAHTHPGSGVPGPSHTDITTFAAIEAALGKRLNWFILSSDSQVLCLFDNEKGQYGGDIFIVNLNTPMNLSWMEKLRELSNFAMKVA